MQDTQLSWRRMLSILVLATAVLFTGSGCDDNPTSSEEDDGLSAATNPIVVELEAVGEGTTMLNLLDLNNYHITICYDDGECDRKDPGKRGISSGSSISVAVSEEGQTVVGVEVDGRIEDAPGIIRVGESATEEPEEFDFNPELNTVFRETDTISPGDEVSFVVGDVE